MKTLLFLMTFLFLTGAMASTMNCKDHWAKGYPDKRFPEGLECQLSERYEMNGRVAEVYHYSKGFPRSPEDTGFSFRTREVFVEVVKVLKLLRETTSSSPYFRPLTFIFTDQKPVKDEIAMVRIGHAADDETCPVIVYIDPFKKQSPQQQKQDLAHEIFHCIQDTMWQEKVTGTSRRAHEWWTEGSAVWFSNFVYPSNNQEYQYNDGYMGHEPLVLQQAEDSYPTYLFFQSFSQGWSGVGGTFDFIERLPSDGDTGKQMAVVLDYPSIELHFHKFAEQLTSSRIKDFEGSLMSTSMASEPVREKIKEGEDRDLEWINPNLTIKIHEIELPPKTIVAISNEVPAESSTNPMSIRTTGSNSEWGLMYPGHPSKMDMSCRAHPKSIDVLSSYAGKDPENEKFKLHIKAEKADCQCVEKVEFDKCLVGNYELDRPSLDKVFARIFSHRSYQVENSAGSYNLEISSTQKFSFSETNFSASVIIKDDTRGDIRVKVTMNGSTEALGKLLSKNEICFSDIGHDYTIHTQVYFPEGTVDVNQPYSEFDDFAQGPTNFRCNDKEVILTRTLPTGPDGAEEKHDLRFVRK